MYSSAGITLAFGPFFSSSVFIWEPVGCSHIVCCSLITSCMKYAVSGPGRQRWGSAGSSGAASQTRGTLGLGQPRVCQRNKAPAWAEFLGISRTSAMLCWKLMLATPRMPVWKAVPSGFSRKSPPALGAGCWVPAAACTVRGCRKGVALPSVPALTQLGTPERFAAPPPAPVL